MTEKRIHISVTRVLNAVLLIFVVVAISKFAYITVESYRLHEDVRQLKELIASDNKAYQRLLQQKDYVTSPAYVERVARGEFQMTKEGEVNITAIFPPGVDVPIWEAPRPTIQSQRSSQPNWQVWWDLFFPPE